MDHVSGCSTEVAGQVLHSLNREDPHQSGTRRTPQEVERWNKGRRWLCRTARKTKRSGISILEPIAGHDQFQASEIVAEKEQVWKSLWEVPDSENCATDQFFMRVGTMRRQRDPQPNEATRAPLKQQRKVDADDFLADIKRLDPQVLERTGHSWDYSSAHNRRQVSRLRKQWKLRHFIREGNEEEAWHYFKFPIPPTP